jgi:hypothetical protein
LLFYSRNINQGAYVSGEAKEDSSGAVGKPIHPQAQAEGCGVKAPKVTDVMPEVGRSRPGQDEVSRKGHGGPISN